MCELSSWTGKAYKIPRTYYKYCLDRNELRECADLIDAKHSIPIHMTPSMLFDEKKAEDFTAKNRLIVKAGEEIKLFKAGL